MRFCWDNDDYRCEEDKIVILQAWVLHWHSEYLRASVFIEDIKNQLEDVKLTPGTTKFGDNGEIVERIYTEMSFRCFYDECQDVKKAAIKAKKSADGYHELWKKARLEVRKAKRKYKRVRS